MKSGGADVVVLNRKPGRSVVESHLRAWCADVLDKTRPPDAYAAVAFWFDPETPGRPGSHACYCTAHDALPAPALVRIAGPYLVSRHAADIGADIAITQMGGEPFDWTPEDAP